MGKGLFNSLRGKIAPTRLVQDKLYEIVLAELKAGDIDEVAKTRATEDAKGEEKKADAMYIKHRIRRIKDEHSSNLMAAKNLRLAEKSLRRQSALDDKGQQSPTNEPQMTEETKTSGGEINTMLIILAVITVVGILVLAFRY